jgi:hypothetical protein
MREAVRCLATGATGATANGAAWPHAWPLQPLGVMGQSHQRPRGHGKLASPDMCARTHIAKHRGPRGLVAFGLFSLPEQTDRGATVGATPYHLAWPLQNGGAARLMTMHEQASIGVSSFALMVEMAQPARKQCPMKISHVFRRYVEQTSMAKSRGSRRLRSMTLLQKCFGSLLASSTTTGIARAWFSRVAHKKNHLLCLFFWRSTEQAA